MQLLYFLTIDDCEGFCFAFSFEFEIVMIIIGTLCWLKVNISDDVAHLMFKFACFNWVFKLWYTCCKLLHI